MEQTAVPFYSFLARLDNVENLGMLAPGERLDDVTDYLSPTLGDNFAPGVLGHIGDCILRRQHYPITSAPELCAFAGLRIFE